MAGMVTCQRVSQLLAPRLVLISTQRGSREPMPDAVFSAMDHRDAMVIRNKIGFSPMPSIITATGIHARGEIMRRNCVDADMVRSKVRKLHMSTPKGTPRPNAKERPTQIRRKVAKVCSHVRGS